ncbi:hypothetical protein Bsph_3034 [Lysinibacillus sphaericus C3-41]|uniref:Uncharacterized protein n=1 Tax=Lysinibacillus sphaericus (strain C3-41) TaxID=444177 RepID=B1HPA7_LYSSC|nr:hypothetical protein Bsph_3034 [Lysinibacillus sphaericus C3-41]
MKMIQFYPFLRHLFLSIQQIVPNFGQTFDTWDQLSRFPKWRSSIAGTSCLSIAYVT